MGSDAKVNTSWKAESMLFTTKMSIDGCMEAAISLTEMEAQASSPYVLLEDRLLKDEGDGAR